MADDFKSDTSTTGAVAVGGANGCEDVFVDGCSESVKTINAKNPTTRQGNALDAKTQAEITAKSGGEVSGGHLCAKIDVYTEGGVLLRKISLSRHIIGVQKKQNQKFEFHGWVTLIL